MLCNIPNVISNAEELITVAPSYYRFMMNGDIGLREETKPCYSPQFWIRILHSTSKLCITLNASACCFLYCGVCQTFRAELLNKSHLMVNSLKGLCCSFWITINLCLFSFVDASKMEYSWEKLIKELEDERLEVRREKLIRRHRMSSRRNQNCKLEFSAKDIWKKINFVFTKLL